MREAFAAASAAKLMEVPQGLKPGNEREPVNVPLKRYSTPNQQFFAAPISPQALKASFRNTQGKRYRLGGAPAGVDATQRFAQNLGAAFKPGTLFI